MVDRTGHPHRRPGTADPARIDMEPVPELRWENAAVAHGRSQTVRELVDGVGATLKSAHFAGPAALVGTRGLDLLAAACWLASTAREGMVLPRERLTDSVTRRLGEAGFAIVDASRGTLGSQGRGEPVPGRVHLLTSGSTGEPKLIGHTWGSLFTMARVRRPRPTRWLLTYQPGTYAWFQLVTALLFMPGQSVV